MLNLPPIQPKQPSLLNIPSDSQPNKLNWVLEMGQIELLRQPALYIAIAVAAIVCWLFWELNQVLTPFPFPASFKTNFEIILAPAMAVIPLLWLVLAKQHRTCLSLATIILLAGDMAPTLASPLVALVTFSNGLYLLWHHRHSQVRWILMPFMLLSVGYFVNAFLWDFIEQPVMVSYAMVLDLGWWGALGGTLLVYHMMYFFLALYHVAVYDKSFLKSYVWLLMIFINVVVGFGLLQSLATLVGGEYVQRMPSIMRLATRLAPFIVVSLPIFIIQLLENPSKREKTFLWLSIGLNALVLSLTQTRGAIGGAIVLMAFFTIGLYRARQFVQLRNYFIFVVFLFGGLWFWAINSDIMIFERFQGEIIQSGMNKRYVLWDAFLEALKSHQTSNFRSFVNLLFGYGWFTERWWVFPHNMDVHNTFLASLTTFGLTGSILYNAPFGWLLWRGVKGMFTASTLSMRPRYGIVAGLILMNWMAGFVHNKFYSPIESAYLWILFGILLAPDLQYLFAPRKIKGSKSAIWSIEGLPRLASKINTS